MKVAFGTEIQPIDINGETKYVPCYIIGGISHMVCHQGKLVYYDTPEEAEEYFDEEE